MRLASPRRTWFVSVALACAVLCGGTRAAAQRANPDDPYRYDLRVALFPLAFMAGVSQSSFGSGLRGELDVTRRLVLQLSGRLPWLEVAGQKDPPGFWARAGLAIHLLDTVEISELAGVVHQEDTASPGVRNRGTDHDLSVPQSQKTGWSRMIPPDRREGRVPVRHVQSLRLGYDLTRAIERARPALQDGGTRYALNTIHALYAGYAFGAHWNLSPATAGEREVGWRRFYFDAVLTLEPFAEREEINAPEDPAPVATKLFPVGLRIGMEGAIGALLPRSPGTGFGYNLELGALPGYSGLEGYLLVNLGLALDLATGG